MVDQSQLLSPKLRLMLWNVGICINKKGLKLWLAHLSELRDDDVTRCNDSLSVREQGSSLVTPHSFASFWFLQRYTLTFTNLLKRESSSEQHSHYKILSTRFFWSLLFWGCFVYCALFSSFQFCLEETVIKFTKIHIFYVAKSLWMLLFYFSRYLIW